MGFKECMNCAQSLPPPLISQKVHDLQNVKSHQLLITHGTCTGVSHSYRSVKYWVEKSSALQCGKHQVKRKLDRFLFVCFLNAGLLWAFVGLTCTRIH